MREDRWPPLPYDEWKATYATLHMWTQVVGKVALALAPPINHAWGIAFHLTPRGMATRLLHHGDRSFGIEFDFVDHTVLIRTTDGKERALRLEPRTVADFHRELMAMLHAIEVPISIWPVPVEIPDPVPFAADVQHGAYDPEAANRCWRILVSVARVFEEARARFIGKCSPVHFFWGAFDLAVTRFSGRPAPPREGPAFMREAYSHEVISHGFWPGSGPILEPAFYAYAVPEPEGLKEAAVEPREAYYHRELGEFVLPYEAVRTARDPEAALMAFVKSTYERAATLGKWDRAALEKTEGREGS